MPFQSKAQQAYMFIHHPAIAKRWAAAYGVSKDLPEHKRTTTKHSSTSKATPSNESPNPKISKLPRPSGFFRDFGNNNMPNSTSMPPRNRSTPNQAESLKETPPEYIPHSRHPGKRTSPHRMALSRGTEGYSHPSVKRATRHG